ncbi:MAG: SGNH hydrolase domain-containing protein, partial [Verrucomicrobia bacterium]|nr:SGNH hydrolase domain-containing protein [Verrucomicrobiota bacterium]
TPVRKRQWLSSRKALFTLTLAVLIGMFGIGSVIKANHGFPQRFDQSVTKYAEAGIKDLKKRPGRDDPELAFNDKLLTFGNTSATSPIRVLLWGDSHAMSIMPPIASLCEEHGLKAAIATHSATPPLLGGFYRRSLTGLDTRSPAWAEAVLRIIKKHQIPDTIITAYWKESIGKSEAAFSEALIHTIGELKAAGTRVWIMLDVPDVYFDPPKALAFHQMLPWIYPDPRKRTPTLAEHEKADRVIRGLVTQLEKAGARVLDPSAFLFGLTNHCLIEVDGNVIYADPHHLTTAGSMKLKPLFVPIFKTQTQP